MLSSKALVQELQEKNRVLAHQVDSLKERLDECKEIIVRNNYKMVHDEEYQAINASLKNRELHQVHQHLENNREDIKAPQSSSVLESEMVKPHSLAIPAPLGHNQSSV